MSADEPSERLVLCEACGGEGRVYRTRSGHANDPDVIDFGACRYCDGTGYELVETEPAGADWP